MGGTFCYFIGEFIVKDPFLATMVMVTNQSVLRACPECQFELSLL